MKNHELNIIKLKDTIQDCNVNFLIGSGMSMPYLTTLGKIEILLTELSEKKESGGVTADQEKIIRVSLYKNFFDGAISKNLDVLKNKSGATSVLDSYKNFLKIVNSIILKRKSTILNKQINIFTTNVDVFLEKSLEDTKVEYNDGFSGRLNPMFNLSNFKKSLFKTSLHYDNTSELPIFNLMKIHGSLTWNKSEKDGISFSPDLKIVEDIKSKTVTTDKLIEIDDESVVGDLVSKTNGKTPDQSVSDFITEYEKLSIVNPNKEKFRETVLNRTYYELLRIYSNQLEKENTVLFVMGFSFADEHIRDVTIRAANSNPTLKIYIISHSSNVNEGVRKILEESNNNNIEIVVPSQKENGKKEMVDEFSYDLKTINEKIFNNVLQIIGEKDEKKKEEK